MDHFVQIAEVEPLLHRQNQFPNHLPSVFGNDSCPEELALPGGVELYKPPFTLEAGAIDGAEVMGVGDYLSAPFRRLPLGNAHMCHFRRGVGTPRDNQRVRLLCPEEKGVLDGYARGCLGGVGKLVLIGDIADGVDPPVTALEVTVDRDACPFIVGNPRSLETDPRDIRSAADGKQKVIDHKLLSGGEGEHLFTTRDRDSLKAGSGSKVNTLPTQPRLENRGDVEVLPRKDPLRRLDEFHLSAETAETLGDLTADRAGADDSKPSGKLGEGKEILVCKVAGLLETRNRRNRRPRSGRDDSPGEAQLPAVDFHRLRRAKASLTDIDIDSELIPIASRRVVVADLCADSAHPLHYHAKVDLSLPGEPHTEESSLSHRLVRPGGADNAFGGHAADVEAVATHKVAFYQSYLCTEGGGEGR